jgi:hypothetical protein
MNEARRCPVDTTGLEYSLCLGSDSTCHNREGLFLAKRYRETLTISEALL